MLCSRCLQLFLGEIFFSSHPHGFGRQWDCFIFIFFRLSTKRLQISLTKKIKYNKFVLLCICACNYVFVFMFFDQAKRSTLFTHGKPSENNPHCSQTIENVFSWSKPLMHVKWYCILVLGKTGEQRKRWKSPNCLLKKSEIQCKKKRLFHHSILHPSSRMEPQ